MSKRQALTGGRELDSTCEKETTGLAEVRIGGGLYVFADSMMAMKPSIVFSVSELSG